MPYCTPSDLANYLPAAALQTTTNAQQTQACADASETADSYLRGRYALPLAAFGSDIKMHTAWIACYLLMAMRGFSQRAGADDRIIERYYAAVGDPKIPGSGWFPGVQRQAIHPDVTPATPEPGDAIHDLPQVMSAQPRGWPQTRGGKPVIG